MAIMPFVGVAQKTGQSQTRQDTPSKEVEQILEYFDVPQEQQEGLANLFNKSKDGDEFLKYFDGLPQEQQEELTNLMIDFTERAVMVVVDSLIEEGLYMEALEFVDSLCVEFPKNTGGLPAPPMVYFQKIILYHNMQESQQKIKAADDCIASISHYQIRNYERMSAYVYRLRGDGYVSLGDYKTAISSYEKAIGLYKKLGELDQQAWLLCQIANCYGLCKKPFTSDKFFENGLSKYLKYFDTSEKWLLQNELVADDSDTQEKIKEFGKQLFSKAFYEATRKHNMLFEKYIQMAVHCGIDLENEMQKLSL